MIGQLEGLLKLNAELNKQHKTKLKKTIAFISGKGGTGKTLLSINIAKYLVSTGKKVLLADMNLNFSNTAVMLNAYAEKSLYSFFSRRSFLKDLIIKEENGIDFLYGDSGRTDFPEIDSSLATLFSEQLAAIEEEYDVVILDMASGAGKELFLFLKEMNRFLLVAGTEPTAIMDAYVMIKLLKENGCFGEKSVIINKCFSSIDGKTAFQNLNSANNHFLREKIAYLGDINFDAEVSKSVINQNIFIENNQNHKVSTQITQISEKILEIIQVANINQTSF